MEAARSSQTPVPTDLTGLFFCCSPFDKQPVSWQTCAHKNPHRRFGCPEFQHKSHFNKPLLLLLLKHYSPLRALASGTIFLHSWWSLTIACLFLLPLYWILINFAPPHFTRPCYFPCSFHCSWCKQFWHFLALHSFNIIIQSQSRRISCILQYVPLVIRSLSPSFLSFSFYGSIYFPDNLPFKHSERVCSFRCHCSSFWPTCQYGSYYGCVQFQCRDFIFVYWWPI